MLCLRDLACLIAVVLLTCRSRKRRYVHDNSGHEDYCASHCRANSIWPPPMSFTSAVSIATELCRACWPAFGAR
jgi:hypothetical protein